MKKFVAGLFVLILAIGIACSRASSEPSAEKLGAVSSPGQVGPFVIPGSWKQASWFIDPLSVSTCASDNNRTCSLSTCGTSGDGPCLTYGSIATRWGTYSPRLLQNTTLTWLSSASGVGGIGDPVYLTPYVENQSWVAIVGTLVSQATAVLGVVTPLNRATPQLTATTFASSTGAPANAQLMVDSTHASREWIYKNSTGTFTVSTPMATTTPGAAPPVAATPWTNGTNSGDTVTMFAPTTVQIVQFEPILTSLNQATPQNNGVILNVTVPSPGASDKADPILVNQWVNIYESRITPLLQYQPVTGANPVPTDSNCFHDIGVRGGGTIASVTRPNYVAGVMGTAGLSFAQFNAGGGELISDIIMAFSVVSSIQFGVVTNAYIETGGVLTVTGAANINGAGAVWGPGGINVQGNAKVNYTAGAGSAASIFLQTGTMQADTQTKVCSSPPIDAAPPACNLTLSASQLDTSLGAVSGCLYVPGGASYCNVN